MTVPAVFLRALAASAAVLGYMAFESQWVRCVRREAPIIGLPAGLDGLVIAHLSDMHLGFRASLNRRASRKAFAMAMDAQPDLIVITGDLAGGPACQRACPHDALIRIDLGNLGEVAEWVNR